MFVLFDAVHIQPIDSIDDHVIYMHVDNIYILEKEEYEHRAPEIFLLKASLVLVFVSV